MLYILLYLLLNKNTVKLLFTDRHQSMSDHFDVWKCELNTCSTQNRLLDLRKNRASHQVELSYFKLLGCIQFKLLINFVIQIREVEIESRKCCVVHGCTTVVRSIVLRFCCTLGVFSFAIVFGTLCDSLFISLCTLLLKHFSPVCVKYVHVFLGGAY